jgi:hypothetical protein
MEQILKSDYIALKEAISDKSQSDLSEEDDQWALVLMRVYRTKTFVKKSKQSVSHQSIRSENNPQS